MSQGQGTISENDLMRKLVNAKKVMNKVDSGNYQRGNIDEATLLSDPSEILNNQNPQTSSNRPVGTPSIERIHNSKLPDSIKKAMIDNPIPQISLNETLDMDIVKGAKRLMEREGMITKQPVQPKQQVNNTQNIDLNSIGVLIENAVRKVLDEKLNQILTAQQTATINENLVLKVGDSIFRGKITGVNKAK